MKAMGWQAVALDRKTTYAAIRNRWTLSDEEARLMIRSAMRMPPSAVKKISS